MAELFSTKHDVPYKPVKKSLFVDGVRYTNSAAKFWPGLIDEVHEDFPACTRIELAAKVSAQLGHEHLFPKIAFEKSFRRLLYSNIQEEMKNTLAELEILGPPSSVQIVLFSKKREIVSREFPLDYIDAEIFPCLIAWPLKWAGIPEYMWKNEFLKGNVTAEDKKRQLIYHISFSVEKHHISEGLYQQSISLAYRVLRN